MNEVEKRTFQLLTLARFLVANTPMVLGYNCTNKVYEELNNLTRKISSKSDDIEKVCSSEEWRKIKEILNLKV